MEAWAFTKSEPPNDLLFASLARAAVWRSDEFYAQELANRSPLGLRYTKESLAFAASHNLADTISKEASLQAFCVDSEDSKEAISAFFHKRQPEWRGR